MGRKEKLNVKTARGITHVTYIGCVMFVGMRLVPEKSGLGELTNAVFEVRQTHNRPATSFSLLSWSPHPSISLSMVSGWMCLVDRL